MNSIVRPHSRRPLVLAIVLAFAAPGTHAATITVNSNDDSAASSSCNLRNAIASVNAAAATANCTAVTTGAFGTNDTIVFGTLASSTITLAQGQLTLAAPVTISGSGQTIDAHGGAYRVLYSTANLSISNLILSGGHASGYGGGVYVKGTGIESLSLNHVSVTGNYSLTCGGGVATKAANLTLNNSIVTANAASGQGGAVYFGGTTGQFINSTISGNTTTCTSNYCAGGVYSDGATLNISGSTISGNTVTGSGHNYVGGGVYAYGTAVSLVNSTVAGNSASADEFVAGGLQQNAAGATLTNTTLSGNTATSTSGTYVTGGTLVGAYKSGSLALANSIVSANTASTGGNPAAASDIVPVSSNSPTINVNFSLVGAALSGTYPGNGNVFNDTPGLGPLKNNGGHTRTMALLVGSPAIDAGSNALAVDAGSQPLTVDQTGAPRIFNTTVDIGAFEFPGDHIFGNGFEP